MWGINFLSDLSRGSVLGAVLYVGLAGAAVAQKIEVPPSEQPNAQAETAAESDQPPPAADAIGISEIPQNQSSDTAGDKAAQEWEENRDIADLRAQQTMARAGIWMVYVAGIQVVIGAVTVGFLWRTLYHARRTADAGFDAAHAAMESAFAAEQSIEVAKQTAQAQLRAYVSFIGGHVTDKPKRAVVLEFQNTGQTPAYRLTGWAAVAAGEPGDFRRPEKSVNAPWLDLGAGGQHRLQIELPGAEELVLRATLGEPWVPHVWGEVVYQDVFGLALRHTRFRVVISEHPEDRADAVSLCGEGNESD